MATLDIDWYDITLKMYDVENHTMRLDLWNGEYWSGVELDKANAQLIIDHLKQQFNL